MTNALKGITLEIHTPIKIPITLIELKLKITYAQKGIAKLHEYKLGCQFLPQESSLVTVPQEL